MSGKVHYRARYWRPDCEPGVRIALCREALTERRRFLLDVGELSTTRL
jgi:hypothetical protein